MLYQPLKYCRTFLAFSSLLFIARYPGDSGLNIIHTQKMRAGTRQANASHCQHKAAPRAYEYRMPITTINWKPEPVDEDTSILIICHLI